MVSWSYTSLFPNLRSIGSAVSAHTDAPNTLAEKKWSVRAMTVATEVDKKCMEQSAKEYAIWREKHCLSGVAWNVYLLNPVWNTDKRRTPSKSVRDFLWQDNFQKNGSSCYAWWSLLSSCIYRLFYCAREHGVARSYGALRCAFRRNICPCFCAIVWVNLV